jgi:hypothetical protein
MELNKSIMMLTISTTVCQKTTKSRQDPRFLNQCAISLGVRGVSFSRRPAVDTALAGMLVGHYNSVEYGPLQHQTALKLKIHHNPRNIAEKKHC